MGIPLLQVSALEVGVSITPSSPKWGMGRDKQAMVPNQVDTEPKTTQRLLHSCQDEEKSKLQNVS